MSSTPIGNNPFVHNNGQQDQQKHLTQIEKNILFFEAFQAPQIVPEAPLNREVKIKNPEFLDEEFARRLQPQLYAEDEKKVPVTNIEKDFDFAVRIRHAEIDEMHRQLASKAAVEKKDAQIALEMNDAELARIMQDKSNEIDAPNAAEDAEIRKALIANDEEFALKYAKELGDAEEAEIKKQKEIELEDAKFAKALTIQEQGYVLVENDLYYHPKTDRLVKREDIN